MPPGFAAIILAGSLAKVARMRKRPLQEWEPRFRFLFHPAGTGRQGHQEPAIAMTEVYLSREGLQKLKDELVQLRTDERPKVRQALQRAREFGDLSENAEYSAAKERLMFLEQRIGRLEETLSRARLIEAEDIPDDKVYIGATVQLADLGKGGELTYTLVSPEEADFDQGKISTVSPIGRGLLGREEGEEVEIKVPAGVLHYKIVRITRDLDARGGSQGS